MAGHTVFVIAAPGVGKTTMILNWVAKANVRTLYMSADTAQRDLTSQLAALATGTERRVVEARMEKEEFWREQYAASIQTAFPNLIIEDMPSPSLKDVQERMLCLTELWGETPQVVVLDTAGDIERPKSKSEYDEWLQLWQSIRELARKFNCVVMVAHHVRNGPARNGTQPPEMADGLFGSDKYPEFVIGLHTASAGVMQATVRKNRNGPKDVPVKLAAHLSLASIEDQRSATVTDAAKDLAYA